MDEDVRREAEEWLRETELTNSWAGAFLMKGVVATDSFYAVVKDRLIEGLVHRPERCVAAIDIWKKERIRPAFPQFLEAICSDPEASYQAGKRWEESYFLPTADRIARCVRKDADFSFKAITTWKSEYFLATAEHLLMGLNDEGMDELLKRKTSWWNLIHPIRGIGDKFFSRLDIGTKKSWFDMMKMLHSGAYKHVAELPASEAKLVVQAYQFVTEDDKVHFAYGLRESLEQGHVRPWAQYIIDYFRKGTKGGALYRALEVVA